MFRRFSLVASLLLIAPALVSVPAVGQEEAQGEFQRDGRRGRGGWRGEGRGGPGRGFERMRERFIEDLELDADQQAIFEEIMTEQRAQWRAHRETWREIRQAEEEGDTARAEELRASLGDVRRGRGMEEAFAKLEAHLSEDQLLKLDEMRDRWQQRGRERMDRLAEQLELDDEQRAQLDEIGENMRERMRARFRDGGGDGPGVEGGRRRGFDGFFDEVEGILREDQIPLLDEVREESRQRFARGGERGPGGDRRRIGPGERQRDQGGGALNRLEESIDFGDGLELDEAQRAAFDAAMRSAKTGLEAGETNEEQALEYVLEALQGTLNRDQIEAFGEMREALREERARDVKVNDVRLLFMAAGGIDFDPQQARAFRDIYKAAAAEFRKVRKDDDAQAKLAEKTKKQIVEILSPRQAQRFERQLERAQRRVGR